MQTGSSRRRDGDRRTIDDRGAVGRSGGATRAFGPHGLLQARLGPAVAARRQIVRVAGYRHQGERLAHLDRAGEGAFNFQVRRDVGPQVVGQVAVVAADLGGDHLRIDQVVGLHRPEGLAGDAVGRERPHDFLCAEVLRNLNREEERVAPRIEVRWLPEIGRTWREAVLWADRHVEFLLPVRVLVAEVERVAAVLVLHPAFVGRLERLTGRVGETGLGAGAGGEEDEGDEGRGDEPHPL